MKHLGFFLVACSATCVALTRIVSGQVASRTAEGQARSYYESGVAALRAQKYAEGLKDLQAVVDSFPASSVAGDAQVEIARHHFEIKRDLAAAQAAADIVLTKYASTSAAPSALVLNGRIAVERSRTTADLDTAVASFDRVSRLYAYSEATPSAIYYAGEAYRLARRDDEALIRYRDVALKYPTSPWTARAHLGASVSLVQTGRVADAMSMLQRVRDRFPDTPEATTALNWNTILYRLYIRPPDQPPYLFAGRTLGSPSARLRDVAAIAVDRHDRVWLAQKTSIIEFDEKGAVARSVPVVEPRALTFGADGVAVSVRQNSLESEGRPPITLNVPRSGRTVPIEEIPALALMPSGDWLVSDRKGRAVHVFSESGKHLRVFSPVVADRLALNALEDVAVLDRDGKSVTVLDRDGKRILQAGARGIGYQFEEPIDLSFDRLGHLYVLDRSKGSVLVFGAAAKLIATLSIPEKSPGAFRRATAFSMDSAGRLYIFDERSQLVQVYQ
jgi:TolA-binding protein